jgi:hypothetical protein
MATRQLLVLGCSKVKRDVRGDLPAIERYDGSAYRVLRKFLREHEWPEQLSVAVLSAKYGLVGGMTGIEDYDWRMSPSRAAELAPECERTLQTWRGSHDSVFIALGKDYLPALKGSMVRDSQHAITEFAGPIGEKLGQIRRFLASSQSTARLARVIPEPGRGRLSYFLPDWDDLLDGDFDFRNDAYSSPLKSDRGEKHCSVLMKPDRISDGILVSLAQHETSKGALRKLRGTEASALRPERLRDRFGLGDDQMLFGDCGAFSYVNEPEPAISVEKAVSLYELHGFDFGASVDHIPVQSIVKNGARSQLSLADRRRRVKLTEQNALAFLDIAKSRKVRFTPIATVQALTPKGYARLVAKYHSVGYRFLALGGLVPLTDSQIQMIVVEVMKTVATLTPRPWIHLFGVYRPNLQTLFQSSGVDSFDSATYFRKAWLRSDQNYLAPNGVWYAAIRVPMTNDPRTRIRLEQEGIDVKLVAREERKVLQLLYEYEARTVTLKKTLAAILAYDVKLLRAEGIYNLEESYRRTLEDRPWTMCSCTFCRSAGINMLIFRGANRNKRRGAHNTLMLYKGVTIPASDNDN